MIKITYILKYIRYHFLCADFSINFSFLKRFPKTQAKKAVKKTVEIITEVGWGV